MSKEKTNETIMQSIFGFNSFDEILSQYPNAVDLSSSDKRKMTYQEVTQYLKSIVNNVMVTSDGEKIAISDDFDHIEKSKDFSKLNRRGKEEIKTYAAEIEKLVPNAVFEKEIPNKDPAKVDVEKFKYYTVPVWINNRAYSILLECGQLKENRDFNFATRKGESNEHDHEIPQEKHIRKNGKLQVLDISYLYNIRNRPLNNLFSQSKGVSQENFETESEILSQPITVTVNYKERVCHNGVLEGFKNAVKMIDDLQQENRSLKNENVELHKQLEAKQEKSHKKNRSDGMSY